MKRVLGIGLSLCLGGSAIASNLNLTVQSNCGGGIATDCSSAIVAAEGATVNYQVVAQLTDTLNDGLALVGFDLTLVAGTTNYPLPQAATPSTAPMNHFANPLGINNPGGYGGTVQGNVLRQAGGGQNTIKNDINNAPYPIGPVIEDVAQSAQVVLTGSFVVPTPCPDGLRLEISSPFANVIKDNESGTPFYKTEAAGVGTIVSLSIDCVPDGPPPIAASTPASGTIDAASDAAGGGFAAVDFTFDGAASQAQMSDFAIDSPTGGTVPSIAGFTPNGNFGTLTLSGPVPAGHWTRITYLGTGGPICIGFLPADQDGSRTSSGVDIIRLVDCLNNTQSCPSGDVNRSGSMNALDIIAEVDLLNAGWNNRTLIANPCGN